MDMLAPSKGAGVGDCNHLGEPILSLNLLYLYPMYMGGLSYFIVITIL